VIDLATRMVIGWQLAEHMRTSLVIDALQMAITHGRVQPGAVFHSDHGCQYTSTVFTTFCADKRVRPSLGRPDSPMWTVDGPCRVWHRIGTGQRGRARPASIQER
jgi:transposase InsO family protein